MHFAMTHASVTRCMFQSRRSTTHSFRNNMLNLKADNLHFCQSQDSSVGWQLDCYSLANQRLRAQEGFGVVSAL